MEDSDSGPQSRPGHELESYAAGRFGWFGTTPDGSLIIARDAGTDEIYALDWELP